MTSALPPLPPPGEPTPREPLRPFGEVARDVGGRLLALGPLASANMATMPWQLGGLATAAGDYLAGRGFDPEASAERWLPGGRTAMGTLKEARRGALQAGVPELGALLFEMGVPDPTDLTAAIKFFHGSPHKWESPKFDPEKIGTGEGSAYKGYGHYSAQEKGVADTYERIGQTQRQMVGDQQFNINDPRHVAARRVWGARREEEGAIENTRRHIRVAREKWQAAADRGDVSGARTFADRVDQEQRILAQLQTGGLPEYRLVKEKGHMYRGIHNVEAEDLLDFDAPFSEQSEKIQAALRQLDEKYGGVLLKPNQLSEASPLMQGGPTGQDVYQRLVREHMAYEGKGRDAAAIHASEELRQAGIPGHWFKDKFSRAGVDEPTRNFVMYPGSEHLSEITHIDDAPIGALAQGKREVIGSGGLKE